MPPTTKGTRDDAEAEDRDRKQETLLGLNVEV
jgi:hypothetical protein